MRLIRPTMVNYFKPLKRTLQGAVAVFRLALETTEKVTTESGPETGSKVHSKMDYGREHVVEFDGRWHGCTVRKRHHGSGTVFLSPEEQILVESEDQVA
ncbi:hypothetical protein GGI35DRAFT_483976 [Trichoderma velutinum]